MCQVLNLKVQVYFTHISNRHIHSFVESTPHVECEVGLETRDARKQQVCLKPAWVLLVHQYEVIFMNWRNRMESPRLHFDEIQAFVPSLLLFSISIYCFLYNLTALY